jgi:DNA polymerase
VNPSEARWRELGLWPQWEARPQAREVAVQVEEALQTPATSMSSSNAVLDEMGWSQLRERVASCQRCSLHQGRRQAVFGVGDERARWLFVGEGPGAEEDQRGEPFVGAAGRLLDQMLQSLGLKRGEDVYIANVVKCRPPQNRTPTDEECAACMPYLLRQIALIQPAVIVALGKVAAHALLKKDGTLGSLRLQQHHFGEIPLVVTWHPAYLLRTPADKAKAWEDLCRARKLMLSRCIPRGDSVGTTAT